MSAEPYYQDDLVVLYLGDCLDPALAAVWAGADVLITDPPYGIGYRSPSLHMSRGKWAQRKDGESSVSQDEDTKTRDAALSLWEGKAAAVFGSWRKPPPVRPDHRIVWHKTNRGNLIKTAPWASSDEEIWIYGGGWTGPTCGSVIPTGEMRAGSAGLPKKLGHPTPKPVGLMELLISKAPPGVIADPFAGSGSTLVAARNLGRQAVGVEIEERYCRLIANRLSQGLLDLGGKPANP
ncbi:MAG: site-specific DNA-methyltransferase [Bifidobacteriaceae bacterium]|jgi:site-specific DNA-methyltransferase (adenine-specific)|nr:site-specific DNA-methyltransferase [Bifidobacteriaceae bacterium]